MNEQGLWALFWATGLPEVWLEVRRKEDHAGKDVPCAAPPEMEKKL